MPGRHAWRTVAPMTDDDQLARLADRVEYVVDQIGTLHRKVAIVRESVSTLRAEVRVQYAELRAEMIGRDGNLLKWLLGFFVAQTAAIAALIVAFR